VGGREGVREGEGGREREREKRERKRERKKEERFILLFYQKMLLVLLENTLASFWYGSVASLVHPFRLSGQW